MGMAAMGGFGGTDETIRIGVALDIAKATPAEASKAIHEAIEEYKKLGYRGTAVVNVTEKLHKTQGRYFTATAKINKEQKGFNYNLLSTMFMGMQLQRTFGGMTSSMWDLYGVTDMYSAALTSTMMPVMDVLTPILYDIAGAIMDAPDSVKMLLGTFILFGNVLGSGLMQLSQMGLFLQAIANMGGPAGALAGILGPLASLGGVNIPITFAAAKNAVGDLADAVIPTFTKAFPGAKFGAVGAIGFGFLLGGAIMWIQGDSPEEKIKASLVMAIGASALFWKTGALPATAVFGIGTALLFMGMAGITGNKIIDAIITSSGGVLISAMMAARFGVVLGPGAALAIGFTLLFLGLANASDLEKARDYLKNPYVSAQTIFNPVRISTPTVGDFMMRPGQAPIQFSPNDTVVGFQGEGGFGSTFNITQNITISGTADLSAIKRELGDELVDYISSHKR